MHAIEMRLHLDGDVVHAHRILQRQDETEFRGGLAGRVLQFDRMAVEQGETRLAQQCQGVGQRTGDIGVDHADLLRLHDDR